MTSQPITPELRQWIIDQAGTGIAAPALIDAMCKAGWNEDVAIQAVEQVLRKHLDDVAMQQGQPPAVRVPGPPLADSPLFIGVGDRQVCSRPRSATPSSPPRARAWRARSPWPRAPAATRSTTTAPATACSSSAERTTW
jgi:hypothetical protein